MNSEKKIRNLYIKHIQEIYKHISKYLAILATIVAFGYSSVIPEKVLKTDFGLQFAFLLFVSLIYCISIALDISSNYSIKKINDINLNGKRNYFKFVPTIAECIALIIIIIGLLTTANSKNHIIGYLVALLFIIAAILIFIWPFTAVSIDILLDIVDYKQNKLSN